MRREAQISPMSQSTHWVFPPELQPKADEVRFDLGSALRSVVMLRAEIPDNAFTAEILGTERFGNGVVIRDDGLVLTIGYLITEASTIWITTNKGAVAPGFPLAYDQTTGCLLYTSDAADERSSVDLGGRR